MWLALAGRRPPRPPRRRRFGPEARRCLRVAAILLLLLPGPAAPVDARTPICDLKPTDLRLREDGCLPTPQQCATGDYNGLWQDTKHPGRFADCSGAAGRVVRYEGGFAGDAEYFACGTVIADDQLTQVTSTGWFDPNSCPPRSAAPDFGVAGRAKPDLVRSDGGVVAAPSPQAAQVGVAILKGGGNAMDAGVAAVFAIGVTRPEMCGIGGGGLLVYRTAAGEVATLDFRETAPAALTKEKLFDDKGAHRDQGAGHRVVGVPGLVAGMAAALERFGTRSLAQAIAPAAALAEAGVPVSAGFSSAYWYTGSSVGNQGRLLMFPEAATLYLRGGVRQHPPDNPLARSILVQADHARSLRLIAAHGPRAFYADRDFDDPEDPGRTRPGIARLLVREMERSRAERDAGDRGLLTAEDLADYRAIWREPLVGTYRGHQIIAMGPPTAGGILALEILNIMEGYNLGPGDGKIKHSSADHLHYFAEAHKVGWADRTKWVADPKFERVPKDQLTSKAYAAERRREIGEFARSYAPGTFPGIRETAAGGAAAPAASERASGQTTHVSVIDRRGNAFAATCSLNDGFGSAVVAPGTGFLLNNLLLDFSEEGRNRPAGGKRPRSSMSPTIVVKDGRPILAVGAPGGTFIPMGVILTISNVVDYGLDVARAVDAARVQEHACCDMILEKGRVTAGVRDKLEDRGHVLSGDGEYFPYPHVQAVGIDPATGKRVGASDPREEQGTTGE